MPEFMKNLDKDTVTNSLLSFGIGALMLAKFLLENKKGKIEQKNIIDEATKKVLQALKGE